MHAGFGYSEVPVFVRLFLCECGAGLSWQKLAYAITPETEHHLVERGEVRQFTVSIMGGFMCTAKQGRLHKFNGWTFNYAKRDILLHRYHSRSSAQIWCDLASLMLKSSVISDLFSAVCMFSTHVLKSTVWIWLVSHSFITGWWFEVMMKMMMAHKGNTDRSILLVVSFLHYQTCGCFVTLITMWLTFCQYQFYSYYTMTVMMADVVPADCLYDYLLYIFCLWSEFNWALLINVIVTKTVQNTSLVTLMFREV